MFYKLLSSAHVRSATHVPHAHIFAVISKLALCYIAPFSDVWCGPVHAQVCSQLKVFFKILHNILYVLLVISCVKYFINFTQYSLKIC